jgi:hypothetical protein
MAAAKPGKFPETGEFPEKWKCFSVWILSQFWLDANRYLSRILIW